MPDNPQRPTEDEAVQRLWDSFPYIQPPSDSHIIYAHIHLPAPLWFDPDEDVEIENPDDEAPEFE